ncbi:MAG: isocitrate lyase/phosphoenolpyruvate mutase family protein [Xanthomonadaceae bacterium]|nr:isocitrate lyase/phosphoenolpyruvate mutase family protein [Xanthomonadaceae bacterium]
MKMEAQVLKAHAFRGMHDRSAVLLLPNAWDAGSARLLARHGFTAIATTSGGLAWSLGYADGEQAPLAEVLAAIARITRVVELPVTVDMESGYGDTLAAVGASVRAVIAAGAVGINLEDGLPGHRGLRPCTEAAARIEAARRAAIAAGVPIVINARVDTCMQQSGDCGASCFDETVQRAQAYLAAGADCIYPIALRDGPMLQALVNAIDAPVNVTAGPGVPELAELARLGIARASTATRLATMALAAVDRAATELLSSGRFDCLASSFSYPDAQRLFDSE